MCLLAVMGWKTSIGGSDIVINLGSKERPSLTSVIESYTNTTLTDP